MPLLDMTTNSEVRSALGVNNIELTDTTLGLEMYTSNLSMELDDVDVDLTDKYVEVADISLGSRTKVQKRFYEACRLFATYAVAKHCCVSLPMFGPKSVADSKVEVSRFSDSPYKETVRSVKSQYDVYRANLITAYANVRSTATTTVTRTVMVVSTPSSDPVTG